MKKATNMDFKETSGTLSKTRIGKSLRNLSLFLKILFNLNLWGLKISPGGLYSQLKMFYN